MNAPQETDRPGKRGWTAAIVPALTLTLGGACLAVGQAAVEPGPTPAIVLEPAGPDQGRQAAAAAAAGESPVVTRAGWQAAAQEDTMANELVNIFLYVEALRQQHYMSVTKPFIPPPPAPRARRHRGRLPDWYLKWQFVFAWSLTP